MRYALRVLLLVVFLNLAAILIVILTHVFLPSSVLVTTAQILTVTLFLLSVGAALVGIAHAWRSFPRHRRAIVFVVALTLVTLLAHAYVIGSPASSAGATLSGNVGSSFNDDKISVNSSVTGGTMNVAVTSTGGDAIVNLNVTLAGSKLSGLGFNPPATYAYPLQPGSSTAGTWNIPSTAFNSSITVSYQYLTCYSTGSKVYGCIMDEVYYVPAAQHMLDGSQCQLGASSSQPAYCNPEHPPLGKALIAAGMAIFGEYSVVGWRVVPALLGTFSIPLLFGIAWKVSGDKRIAYLSSLLLALDVMFFSQSGGALIDIPEVFFALAAFFAYFAELKVWKLDKYVISGAIFGLAGLAKEPAIFMALALLTYIAFFGEGRRSVRFYNGLKVAIAIGLVFFAGLQVYDSAMVSSSSPTFTQHLSYMLSYGESLNTHGYLECQGGPHSVGYWCKYANDPGGPPILPFDWLVFYSPITYYATSVSVCPNTVNGVCQGGQYSYVQVGYYGVTTFLETWTVFVWVPLIAYALYRSYRRPGPSLDEFVPEGTNRWAPELKFAGLTLVWFLWSFLPYVFLFFAQRVTYPFYFIPGIPAVALGASYWLTRSWFPRKVVWIYLIMVFIFFFVYFPDKSFLPEWLRALIGR